MNKFIAAAVVLISMFSLSACKEKVVSFDTLEAARSTANDNSKFNAVKYKTENQPDSIVKMRGDSSQKNNCPQGDGWATIDLLNSTGQKIVTLKCSTYSFNLGCYTKKDFDSRSYAQEDGKCNEAVPFPLPKITG